MLYDPKWSETKADPMSLASLIAWLELQPASTAYDWKCFHGCCLIAKYGNAVNIDWKECHEVFWLRGQLSIASARPHTFGAALKRARALQS